MIVALPPAGWGRLDVLLLDIRLGQETGFQLLERNRDAVRRPAVVVLTAFAQAEYAAAAYRLGAASLVLKAARLPELVNAIRKAAARKASSRERSLAAFDPTLTTREQEVVRHVVEGRTNDEIALALSIASKTVEGHLRRVFERLGIESRAELGARAVLEGGSMSLPSPAAEGMRLPRRPARGVRRSSETRQLPGTLTLRPDAHELGRFAMAPARSSRPT